MIDIFAIALTKLPVRLLLALLGAAASWLFGPTAIAYALAGAADLNPLLLFLGGGGTLGLLGWWVRLVAPPAFVAGHATFRRFLFGLLVFGTASATYVAIELGGPWRWISVPVAIAGAVMALGTTSAPGPNNSFKPKPLRGSA